MHNKNVVRTILGSEKMIDTFQCKLLKAACSVFVCIKFDNYRENSFYSISTKSMMKMIAHLKHILT